MLFRSQVYLDLDREKAKALGLPINAVFDTMQATFGQVYVNDFNQFGRTYRVQLQSEADYRAKKSDIRNVYVRSDKGEMIPLSSLVTVRDATGPELVERFNIFQAAKIMAQPAPGYSSGQAIAALEEVFERFPLIPKALEIKVPDVGMEAVLCEMLAAYDQLDRVIVGSFHERSLKRFRELCPEVATSAGPVSVRLLLALNWLGLSDLLSPSYPVLQIPPQHSGLTLPTPRLIRNARTRGLHVQLWTINEQPEMRRLLEMGANGLITDYPDRALQLLGHTHHTVARHGGVAGDIGNNLVRDVQGPGDRFSHEVLLPRERVGVTGAFVTEQVAALA